jgi:hypothetical protein
VSTGLFGNKACAAQFPVNVDSQGGGWSLNFSQGILCSSTQVSHFKMSMYIDGGSLVSSYTQSYVAVNGSITQLTAPFSGGWNQIDVPLNFPEPLTSATFAFYPPLDAFFPFSATVYIDDLEFY